MLLYFPNAIFRERRDTIAKRERWSSRLSFILAAVGSAVGLGNAWRFPYVAYTNGGGAFLIPYFIALFTAGIPLMILEYGLGQSFQSSAPLAFAKIKKRFEFIGWWALGVGTLIVSYYAVIMSYSFNYLFHSITLSWAGREESFFMNDFLRISSGPGELGSISVPILLGLILTWLLIYLCISKGTESVGKVVMLTVPLPVLLMVVLVIRGLTLPGSMEGLVYYLTPDFSKLLSPSVWLAAYSQVFFSLSLGFGLLIAYASYKPKDSDITNDAFITSLINAGISYLAGFAVFSVLGFFAFATQTDISQVVSAGPGLAFVVYPAAIAKMPIARGAFGVVFFLMLLTLGIDSAFSIVEGVVAGIQDKFRIANKQAIIIGYSAIVCLIGIIYTTQAGLYWLDIVDHWMNNFGLAPVGLAECLVIGYFFTTDSFRRDINSVSDFSIGKWWNVMIRFITPLVLTIVIVLNIITEIKKPYENYPFWSTFVGGWLLVALIIILAFILGKLRGKEVK